MEHTTIEIKKLVISPENARRTGPKAASEELKASILAHGLMQNLVVTLAEDGNYRVIAGGRRLAALQSLQAEGKLGEAYAVPCQIAADERAYELSLAENIVRQAMHPADEFEAFARLVEQGETTEAIAARFGITVRHVEQRLTLGRLDPALLDAYREGGLTLDCLMAFTITDDRQKQLAVYQSLQPWQAQDARSIRSMLTGEMAEASSKLARFVGLDAYHEAGGASRGDLFGDRIYLEDAELLHRLAAEKLEAARQEIAAEGWKWVEAAPEADWTLLHGCGRIHPVPADAPAELLERQEALLAELEQLSEDAEGDGDDDSYAERQEALEAELAELQEKLEGYAAFDPADREQAGCFVSIGPKGELDIEKGLVRREDRKRLAGTPARPKGIPRTLLADLAAYRLQAAQVELARHRLVALDLLAFHFALQAITRHSSLSGLDIRLNRQGATKNVEQERTPASQALAAIAASLPSGWLHHATEAAQFEAFIALPEKDRLDFLAYGVAICLEPQLATGRETSAWELALALTEANLSAHWRPTRSGYLSRVTRHQLLEIGRELFGSAWAQAHAGDKKGELADLLERAFADPQKHARNPQQLEAIRSWLPAGMAFIAPVPEPATPDLADAA